MFFILSFFLFPSLKQRGAIIPDATARFFVDEHTLLLQIAEEMMMLLRC